MTNAKVCAGCGCCTAYLCAVAQINRKSCVDYALVWTTEMEAHIAGCPCAPQGVQYPPPPSNVIPFPSADRST